MIANMYKCICMYIYIFIYLVLGGMADGRHGFMLVVEIIESTSGCMFRNADCEVGTMNIWGFCE